MQQQVDILLPAFNEEKRIASTIESIQKSTYTNWRLLIIDDCSTDKTKDVVSSYIDEDSRIVLIENQENMHIARSLNNGLNHCKNEYVFRIDAGDLFYPDRIEKQVAVMNEKSVDLCGGNILIVNDDFKGLYQSNNILSENGIKRASKYINTITHSTYCFKLSSVMAVKGYRDFVPAEDYDLLIRLLLNGARVMNVSDNLVYYHDYDLGISKLGTVFQGVLACKLSKNFRHKRIMPIHEYTNLKSSINTISTFQKKYWAYKFKMQRLWVRILFFKKLGGKL
jgi:glycosyltransferase involved in cell wall biosynthesis